MPNKNNDRPTFYLNDDQEKPLRAGGVMFYRFDMEEFDYKLLLIYSRDKYEDFGGCTDAVDDNIKETVSREVEEESNKIFSQKYILDNIKDDKSVYIKHCKYILYFMELEEKYDPEIFGNREIHDGFDRTVEWVPYDNFEDKEFLKTLNCRLNNWTVTKYMKKILT
jgi:ADP-ribose pyrophosphatase YjhB (NUDIX family)